jgi:hypothetical protein
MAERLLISGNEAIGWGAILGECKAFFGYPITPQSEILEFLASELPKAGGVWYPNDDCHFLPRNKLDAGDRVPDGLPPGAVGDR